MSDTPLAVRDALMPIHEALETEGITHEYLAKKLKDELEATEIRKKMISNLDIHLKQLIEEPENTRVYYDLCRTYYLYFLLFRWF